MALNTINQLEDVLKEKYLPALRSQLAKGAVCLKMFKKGKVSINGKYFLIPVHIGRNDAVGYRQEDETLGLSEDGQKYASIPANAKYMYGEAKITGPSMAATERSGSMVGSVQQMHREMEGLKNDILRQANKKLFFGHQVRGFLCEHKASSAGTGASTFDANGGAVSGKEGEDTWEYAGDYSEFGSPTTDPETWTRVKLIRLDTYDEIVPQLAGGGDDNDAGIFVSSASATEKRNFELKLAVGTSAGAGTFFTTANVEAGYAIAVLLHETRLVDGGGLFLGKSKVFGDGTAGDGAAKEPFGIFSNLANRTYLGADNNTSGASSFVGGFKSGVDRSDTASTADSPTKQLQSIIMVNNNSGAHARTDLEPDRIQFILSTMQAGRDDDDNKEGTDDKTDVMVVNPMFLSLYSSLLDPKENRNTKSAEGLDLGYDVSSSSYAGIPFKTDRQCPRGVVIGLCLKTWACYELAPGEFDTTDGLLLRRDGDKDKYKAVWKWYYNHCCDSPHSNWILTGFNIRQ